LRARGDYRWPDLIPRFYSYQTFYAESALSALQATGRTDLIRKFNLPFLYMVCVVFYPEYFSLTMHSLRHAWHIAQQHRVQFFARFPLDIFRALGLIFSKRLARRRSGVSKIKATIEGINNSQEATQSLVYYLKSSGRKFDDQI
jgi:hypothetical protein